MSSSLVNLDISKENQVTYGDVSVTQKTKEEEPAETVLTLPVEYCSK